MVVVTKTEVVYALVYVVVVWSTVGLTKVDRNL